MDRSPKHLIGFFAALGEDHAARSAAGRFGTVLLLAALALGLGFRLYLAVTTRFPINDGALFYEFVRGIAEVFPALPERVAYNGIAIPFAYPPLSFWAAAALAKAGVPAIEIVRLAPIAMNGAYLLLFAALLLRSGHSRLFTAIALLFLVASMRSFEWLVMGGGLSRGLGSLFLLTLLASGLPPAWTKRDRGYDPSTLRLVTAGLCIAGAILSHLEWGILTVGCFVVARALAARSFARFAVENLIAGSAALLLVLPWLGLVVSRHGLEPFLAAGGTSDWDMLNSVMKVPALLLHNRGNLFLLLGCLVLLARRDLFWPLFLLVCLFLTPRHADTPVVLGIAAISAHGVLAFLSLLRRTRLPAGLAPAATALLVVLVLGWQQVRDLRDAGPFRPLSASTLQTMRWVRDNHPGANYAVMTPYDWWYDAPAEWFPTLTGTRSVTTVQGREWLPDGAFARADRLSRESKEAQSCDGMLRALAGFGRADFIWVQTRHDCFRRPAFEPVHRAGDVTIFKVARR